MVPILIVTITWLVKQADSSSVPVIIAAFLPVFSAAVVAWRVFLCVGDPSIGRAFLVGASAGLFGTLIWPTSFLLAWFFSMSQMGLVAGLLAIMCMMGSLFLGGITTTLLTLTCNCSARKQWQNTVDKWFWG